MASPPDRTGTRINLTIPPETVRAIDRMAAASGVGRATFVREILVGMETQFHELAEALEIARQNKVDSFGKMAKIMRNIGQSTEQLELEIKRTHRAAMRKRKP